MRAPHGKFDQLDGLDVMKSVSVLRVFVLVSVEQRFYRDMCL